MKTALTILLLIPFISFSQCINKNNWKGKIKSIATWRTIGDHDTSKYIMIIYYNRKGDITHVISPALQYCKFYLDTLFYDQNDQHVKTESYEQLTDTVKKLYQYILFSFDSALEKSYSITYDLRMDQEISVITDKKTGWVDETVYKKEYFTKKPYNISKRYKMDYRVIIDSTCVDERYNDLGDIIEQYNTEVIYESSNYKKASPQFRKKMQLTIGYDSLGSEILLKVKEKKIVPTFYVYEYDQYQNWTKQTCLRKGELISVAYRKIEYY